MYKNILCVDCDGTLIRTDLIYEAILNLLKQSFHLIFLLPFWLLKGKAYFKDKVANYSNIDASLLPYNESFLEFLKSEKNSGREIALVTASHKRYADNIAEHLGIFATVIATQDGINMSGRKKADYLCHIFGERQFDYAGNGRVDLHVWRHAAKAIVVSSRNSLTDQVAKICRIDRIFSTNRFQLINIIEEIRFHQWLKNTLVFVPLVAAHKINNLEIVSQGILSFISFGFCASSGYIINDLLDLPSDRAHPIKQTRAFASGNLPVIYGVILSPLLLSLGIAIAMLLPLCFLFVLIGYWCITNIYSLWLKKFVIIDVITLAALYIIRIVAGGAATALIPSFWLLVFSLFLFISLAIIKRHAELMVISQENGKSTLGRGYRVADLPLLLSIGNTCGYISILVFALYINNPDVNKLYQNPTMLWLILPLLLYWISRVWLKSHRGEMDCDPVIFAMKDKISLVIAGLIVIILILSTLGISRR
jgi:4-hydroxybenzoate polyprenyltransferase